MLTLKFPGIVSCKSHFSQFDMKAVRSILLLAKVVYGSFAFMALPNRELICTTMTTFMSTKGIFHFYMPMPLTLVSWSLRGGCCCAVSATLEHDDS